MMTSKERITRQIDGREVDRLPLIGGWNLGIDALCDWAGISRKAYLGNPEKAIYRANKNLGADGIVSTFIQPKETDELRDSHMEEGDFVHVQPEALRDRADAIPDSEKKIIASLDIPAMKEEIRKKVTRAETEDGLVVLMTDWGAPSGFSLYFTYGYIAFFEAVGIYPEAVEAIYWEDGVKSRVRNGLLLDRMKELDMVPLLFCGDDMCNGNGPMVSPDFMRKSFWPYVKDSLSPLVDGGIRLIHHCDGNVMPLIDDMLEAGYTGFQGYQYEDGFDPILVRDKALAFHPNPVFLGGLSITRTLVHGNDADVQADIDYLFSVTDQGKGMLLFTSNVSGRDVHPDRIRNAYAYGRTLIPGISPVAHHSQWPWQVNHPAL